MIDFLNDAVPAGERQAIIDGASNFDCYPLLDTLVGFGSTERSPIHFQFGTYRFLQTINLKRNVRMSGDGVGLRGVSHTVFKFPTGSDGLIVNRHNTLGKGLVPSSPPYISGAADGSIISGITFDGGSKASGAGIGIRMRARASIRDCQVMRFGQDGVAVVASWNGDEQTLGNANLWDIQTSAFFNNGRHGLYVDGADANAGMSMMIDVSSNGGWGIYDSSFLGNTHVVSHAADNELGSYHADDPNARVLFVGAYAEQDNAADVRFPSAMFGGPKGANVGNSQDIGEGRQTPFDMPVEYSGRKIMLSYGRSGKPLMMVADGDHPVGWGWEWHENIKSWVLSHANLGARRAYALTTNLTGKPVADGGAGHVMMDGSPVQPGQIVLNKVLVHKGNHRYESVDLNQLMNRLEALEAAAVNGSTESL